MRPLTKALIFGEDVPSDLLSVLHGSIYRFLKGTVGNAAALCQAYLVDGKYN